MIWDIGPDQYYAPGYRETHLGGVNADCLPGVEYCPSVSALDYQLYVDGVFSGVGGNTVLPLSVTTPEILSEGGHSGEIKFTAHDLCPGSIDRPYSFGKSFYVDSTLPTVTLNWPRNNIVLSTADDLSVAGNISDTGSKLGAVYVKIEASQCEFRRDLSGSPVHSFVIQGKFCSADKYDPDSCTVNMGAAPSNFPINYDLRDLVDFSQGRDCSFGIYVSALDRVGYADSNDSSFVVDQEPPEVYIASWLGHPSVSTPIVAGQAADFYSEIKYVKLKITQKDRGGNETYWSGSNWLTDPNTFINLDTPQGYNKVAWSYAGLTAEDLGSGEYKFTVYAADKFGHVGSAEVSSAHKKRNYLGSKEFTNYALRVKEVKNVARPEDTNSFIMKSGEDVVGITAEILPARLSQVLAPKVKWNVFGANAVSGDPVPPLAGTPSRFYVKTPPIAARPDGRNAPMGYTVFPRIEYEGTIYSSPDHESIFQDTIDKCRQEYVDMVKTGEFNRTLFKTDVSVYNTGDCGAYIMSLATIASHHATVSGVAFTVLITSAYRNPIHNSQIGSVALESPHMYGRAIDLAPNLIDCADKEARALHAQQMQLLFNVAPSPKLLERQTGELNPANTADDNYDGIIDVFDACLRGGADHVHIGSGNY
jgi:hypothetical protein